MMITQDEKAAIAREFAPKVAKHTPGPWQVVENPDSHRGENAAGICCAEDTYVADVYKGYVGSVNVSKSEQMANARLIAAAPDLYDALKDALSLIETLTPLDGDTCRKARKAIAKAEGAQ